jgi:hypothetical protein
LEAAGLDVIGGKGGNFLAVSVDSFSQIWKALCPERPVIDELTRYHDSGKKW